jgi:hypothetical protein
MNAKLESDNCALQTLTLATHAHVGVLAVSAFTCSKYGLFLLPGENFEAAICSLGGQRVGGHTDSWAFALQMSKITDVVGQGGRFTC